MRAAFEAIGMRNPDYIGDGVYVGNDGYHIKIALCDGISISSVIALEKPVFRALINYRDRMIEDKKLPW